MRRLQQTGSDEVVLPVQLQGLTPPVRITWQAPAGWEREVIAEWTTGSQTGRTEFRGTTGAASWPVAPGAVLLRVQPPVHAYLLAQNYPNPFNPETEIRFEVPAATKVRVAVYTSCGWNPRTSPPRGRCST